jgi:hypothetical protein
LQICEEFHWLDLSAQLSQFRQPDDSREQVTMEESEARTHRREEPVQERYTARLDAETGRTRDSAVEALVRHIGRLETQMSAAS